MGLTHSLGNIKHNKIIQVMTTNNNNLKVSVHPIERLQCTCRQMKQTSFNLQWIYMLGILFSEHLSTSHETHCNLSIRRGAGWLRMDFLISLLRNDNEESQYQPHSVLCSSLLSSSLLCRSWIAVEAVRCTRLIVEIRNNHLSNQMLYPRTMRKPDILRCICVCETT